MIAQASEMPSKVLVPRPISSRITRLRGVALLRMLAVSVISTMNVLWPAAQLVGRADAGEEAVDDADPGPLAPARSCRSGPAWRSARPGGCTCSCRPCSGR